MGQLSMKSGRTRNPWTKEELTGTARVKPDFYTIRFDSDYGVAPGMLSLAGTVINIKTYNRTHSANSTYYGENFMWHGCWVTDVRLDIPPLPTTPTFFQDDEE